jgi:hypothetical protein
MQHIAVRFYLGWAKPWIDLELLYLGIYGPKKTCVYRMRKRDV